MKGNVYLAGLVLVDGVIPRLPVELRPSTRRGHRPGAFMEENGGSLSDLTQGASHGLINAQIATLKALDEVKNTSRVLLERIDKARAHRLPRHLIAANHTMPRLPRSIPFGI
jgi:hypothetical protein